MPAFATIDPETIRHELSELWVGLAKAPEPDELEGVLRACSMTLVSGVDEADDPSGIGQTLASLMREHPSRAIVIRLRKSLEPALSARVFAQCWMPFGRRRQICCEQIEIIASESSLADVPAVVLPLAVADLPVMFWCRSARLFHLPAFEALAGVAHKIIVDSAAFPDHIAALGEVSDFAGRHQSADLAWTRLTRWRELIAQIFENRAYLAELAAITGIRILFEGEYPSSSAFYIGAWLTKCLRRTGANPELSWVPASQSSIILETDDGVHTDIRHIDGAMIAVRVQNQQARTVFPPIDDYSLLREELSIPGRDPVFEASLPAAAELSREYYKEHS